MTWTRWWTAVVGPATLLGLGIPALAPAEPVDPPPPPVSTAQPAPSPTAAHDGLPHFTLHVTDKGGYDAQFCLKSDTTKTYPRGVDRTCSAVLLAGQSATLTVDAKTDDRVYLDFEVFGEHTHNDIDITGGHDCDATGTVQGWKLDCHLPTSASSPFPIPTLSPFAIDVSNQNDPAMSLLNLLAWCVSAAAVAGFIMIGINMALQLRRGEPGEFSEHWRGMTIVVISCILGMTAGPIVQFLHIV